MDGWVVFGKIYHFPTEHPWTFPSTEVMFANETWKVDELQDQNEHLNEVKCRLNDFPVLKWHRHSYYLNPTNMIMYKLRREYGVDFVTQTWCKFFEILSANGIIPYEAVLKKGFNTVHLCEAPGSFIAALNHYLVSKAPELKWDWLAASLNPHYEGNDRDTTFTEDMIILSTYDKWIFGPDSTGNITNIENMINLEEEVVSRGHNKDGKLLMVTADGSIDCRKTPWKQEKAVCNLLYCEVITALKILDLGGSLVIKTYTFFECNTICLFYILICSFKSMQLWKPATSREGNSELYLVCLGYKGKCILEPWLDVLGQHYGNITDDVAVFPQNAIPMDFMECIKECSKIFLEYQVEAINRKITLYEELELPPTDTQKQTTLKYKLHELRRTVAEKFCSLYEMEAIPRHSQIPVYIDKITKGTSLKWVPDEYQEPNDPTLLAKLQEPSMEEKILTLKETLKNSTVIKNSFDYDDTNLLAHPLNDFVSKFVQLYPFIMVEEPNLTIGKKFKKTRLSRFSHGWFLDIFEQISSLYELIKESRNSCLTSENVAEGSESMPSTSAGKHDDTSENVPASTMPPAQGLWNAACSETSTILHLSKESKKPDYKPIPASTMAKIWELSSFLRNEKYEILHWKSSRDSTFLHEVIRTLDMIGSNENLMILDPFPLLTQFEVGLVYLMGILFKEVYFICPVPEKSNGPFAILLQNKNSHHYYHSFVQNHLSELLRITIEHEVEESGKQVISILPLKSLLDDYKFYGSVLFANHLSLEKLCNELIHNCEKELACCETFMNKLDERGE